MVHCTLPVTSQAGIGKECVCGGGGGAGVEAFPAPTKSDMVTIPMRKSPYRSTSLFVTLAVGRGRGLGLGLARDSYVR